MVGAAYGNLWARKLRPAMRDFYHRVPVPVRRTLNRLRKPLAR